MDLAEYRSLYADVPDAAPGWDAIDAELGRQYSSQAPLHWGTVLKHMLGGPDPLDGISAYACEDGGIRHLHFCSYGYSSLYYDEAALGGDYSRFGFEMTFRLANPPEDPVWVCSLLQNIARYVFKSGKWFEAYQWIPTNGPIRAGHATDIVGLAFAPDATLEKIATPHGSVEFLQAFGITASEIDALKSKALTCQELLETHRAANPLLVTDLDRRDG
ncbi:MAG: suppressor of fused domain protein [Luteolibacter sp.]